MERGKNFAVTGFMSSQRLWPLIAMCVTLVAVFLFSAAINL